MKKCLLVECMNELEDAVSSCRQRGSNVKCENKPHCCCCVIIFMSMRADHLCLTCGHLISFYHCAERYITSDSKRSEIMYY